MIIRYPTTFPGAERWHPYLALGFERLGHKVRLDKNLDLLAAPGLKFELRDPKHIAALTVGGKRVWYDYSDFVDAHPEWKADHEHMFKIQLKKKDASATLHPIGQTIRDYAEYCDVLSTHKADESAYDVFWVGANTNYSLRLKAAQIVSIGPWKNLVGLHRFRSRPEVPKEYQIGRLLRADYLKIALRSKICLALPGVEGDWTWRHSELLGMGKCMITVESEQAAVGSPCWITVNRDLSDLAETIDHFLSRDKLRQDVAANGRIYFNRWLSPQAQARYIIDTI